MRNDFTASDVFRIIAETLSGRKSLAALSNYQVLDNNINYVNNLFSESLLELSEILSDARAALKDDSLASAEAKNDTCQLYYFRKILPRLVMNEIQIAWPEKLVNKLKSTSPRRRDAREIFLTLCNKLHSTEK